MTMMDILTAITLWERESYKIRPVLNTQRIHMRCEISTPKGGEVEQSSKLWLSPPTPTPLFIVHILTFFTFLDATFT